MGQLFHATSPSYFSKGPLVSKQQSATHFQNNYKEHVNFKFTGNQISNLTAISVTTAVQALYIVAQTGVKQTGHKVSAQRGQLATDCPAIKATRNVL